ncbi:nucleotidyltransferase domain-containing protein [Calderihabitans maritimus]|uniref:Polymerase beta nucleotidyltransferase domain-containing protein n=1 Tax=Calderihabitans maritimus TaxID=1246530 RepID=A0A1Z5HPL8_9FIRM|nr:nucleotidyltransferase domain-containing protein [Calderihabitans maritimus]GAW91472.1 hypothetical protein KKC1_06340 [Calderihabitans maritimus]
MRQDKDVLKGLKRIVEEMVRRYSPERIVIFGSYATGGWYQGEPVDMLIITEDNARLEEEPQEKQTIYLDGLAVTPLVLSPQEISMRVAGDNDLIEEIIREGVVVYEKDLSRYSK